ncbi:MAG: HPr kinase/phosphatase C-terminal domain-containing protein [Sulfitobacter sp.]
MAGGASTSGAPNTTLHASCVSYLDTGVLICGASGNGKSSLALQLMAFGAILVADDRTILTAHQGILTAQAPPAIAGLIEARGVGVLQAETLPSVRVSLVIDLDHTETTRLPCLRNASVLGICVPSLHKVESSAFPAAILQYVKAGRRDPS